jgi:hypothetical protein
MFSPNGVRRRIPDAPRIPHALQHQGTIQIRKISD